MIEIKRNEYLCKFCNRLFVRESAYLTHKCRQMKRAEQMQTVTGMAAYNNYCDWMRIQKKTPPKAQTFMTSGYYNSFIKFAEFAQQVKIPDVQIFIRLMVNNDMPPTLWTTDDVYRFYLEYLDKNTPPNERAKIMIKTMQKIADAADCDVDEIFDILTPNEVLHYIRERKFTPWLLLKSSKFKKMLTQCTKEEQKIFETLINPTFWSFKFDKEPNTVKLMEKLAKDLNI